MADYGVNIAVAVKNSQAITQLSGKIKETAKGIQEIESRFNSLTGVMGNVLPGSIKNFNKALSDAANNLNDAALGSEKAADAARDYVAAQNELNAALKQQNDLLRQARLAGSQVSATPFGPEPGPRFDPAQGRQQAIARLVMLETAGDAKVADAKRKHAFEINKIKLDLDRKVRNAEIDNLIKQYELENKNQNALFENAMKLDREEGERFDKNLKRKIDQQIEGDRKVAEARKQLDRDIAQKQKELEKQVAQARKDLSERIRLTGQTSPIGGAIGIPGSPAAKAAQANNERALRDKFNRDRRFRSAQSSALIGGAFPLLFGQGLGAAAGGAVGGFGGGMIGGEFGFGLSLVGTQIGSMIDQLASKASDLGKALNPATADIDAIVEALGMTGQPSARFIESLRELAGEQVALREATRQLASLVGDDGVTALREFGNASTELGNALTQLTTQVLASVARLTGGITQEIANTLSTQALLNQAQASADPRQIALQQQLAGVKVTPGERGISLERATIEKQMVDTQRVINEEVLKEQEARGQALKKHSAAAIIAQNNLKIARLNSDLTNDSVFTAERSNIFQEARLELSKKDADESAIRIKRETRLTELANRRQALIESANKKQNTASSKNVTLGDRIEQQLKKQLSRYEEIDPIARKRAIIDADHLAIMERISTVQDDIKRKDLETLANSVRTARQNDLNQQIQDKATEKAERQTKLFENKLTSAKQEGRLLQATLYGREEEEALLIKIENLTKGMSAPRAEQLEYQLRQNETLKQQVEMAEKLDEMYKQIGSTLASSLSSALQSVINKTESLGDAVRGVLVDIGNMLLRMGIETAVKAGFSALTSSNSNVIQGQFSTGSMQYANLFAGGGYVNKPTNAVIGEGGQGEYVIPESKMRESMARYSRGARGASVIPESGEAGTVGGGGGTAVAAPIDVRYTVERINDVEYVTAAQFQAGMQQAAAQGAQRGEQQTLRRLQMSGSTRRRIGL